MLSDQNTYLKFIKSLRIEEIIGLVFILPTLLIRLYSLSGLSHSNEIQSMGSEEDLWWIGFISILIIWFYTALRIKPETKTFKVIRDFAPFLFVIAIFANIQIFIFLINPHDFHFVLAELEAWMFGLQPTVWLEKFTHPILTEWFSFSYMSFYWITLVLLIVLYSKKQEEAFRTTMFTMIISYYLGFVGYLLFPAASPYLVIPDLYSVDIWENSSYLSKAVRAVVELSPERTRDAFPSMHNSITLLTMIMAWRYKRVIFWLLLPLALSLPIATLYLRYHFAVDIIAGVGITFLAMYIAPLLENWWSEVQKGQGLLQRTEKSMEVEA